MSDAKALRILFKSPVTDDMIRYLTNTTLKVIPCAKDAYPSPPSSPRSPRSPHSPRSADKTSARSLPSLMTFISRLVRYTNVYTSTLLTAACYLDKLKRLLPRDAHGLPSTSHRIFLACLILSAKCHNDSSPQNKHWAEYTDGLFSLEDVNLMERQLLQLFNWDVRVCDEDLYSALEMLLTPIKHDLVRSRKVFSRNYYHQRNMSACSSTSTLVSMSSSASVMSLPKLPSVASHYDTLYAHSECVATNMV